MNIEDVEEQTRILVANGHRVFQIHRFAEGEHAHVTRLERWAEFPKNAHVIDMGSGTGEAARIMGDIRPDLSFTLVNISQVQLDYSPKEMKQHCCDFCNVPEKDKTFDAAMFCFSIGHADLNGALREAYRLLKSDGILFVYDMSRISGDNRYMAAVEYQVYHREEMEIAANNAGLSLDIYMEPSDDGKYGKSVIGEAAFESVFNGTIPAIWRFVKC